MNMTKVKRLILTNEWVEMKEMFEANTNGNDEYGKNFKIGGELDILSRTFLDKLGDLTSLKGHYCIIDGVKMGLWKERLWSVIENAGLLAPIAWKTDLALEEEMAAKIAAQTDWENDEFDDIEDYEPSDEEVRQSELKLK
jgi:hypothetical protein|tara:strand:- start:250 stop:669 length:420 start_codon:yes stop_codon:yes gene_type:complete